MVESEAANASESESESEAASESEREARQGYVQIVQIEAASKSENDR